MREVDRAKRLRGFAARRSPHEPGAGPDHRVAPAHHVQTIYKIANVRMRAREIRQRDLSPAAPICLQQTRARDARVLIAKRIVVSENRWTTIDPALMRGYHITERRALIKHVVPREREVALRTRARSILEREVRHHPRAEMKLGNVRRRIVAIRPHDV